MKLAPMAHAVLWPRPSPIASLLLQCSSSSASVRRIAVPSRISGGSTLVKPRRSVYCSRRFYQHATASAPQPEGRSNSSADTNQTATPNASTSGSQTLEKDALSDLLDQTLRMATRGPGPLPSEGDKNTRTSSSAGRFRKNLRGQPRPQI